MSFIRWFFRLGLALRNPISVDVFEQLPTAPRGWKAIGRPDPHEAIQFRISLESPHIEYLRQEALDIATPGHPSYGQFIQQDHLRALLRPTEAARDSVLGWLGTVGVQRIEDDVEWISFVATVRQAENLLDTTFYRFRNGDDDQFESLLNPTSRQLRNDDEAEQIRTLQYSLPPNLHQYINTIQPTTRFIQLRAARSTVHEVKVLDEAQPEFRTANSSRASDCNREVTPECLRQLYNISFTPDPRSGSTLGIAGFLEQYAQYADLAQFLDKYVPEQRDANFSVTPINGGLNTQGNRALDSTEANLDIQYGLGLSYPIPATYYSTPGRGPLVPDLIQRNQALNTNEPYLDFLNYLLKLPESQLPRTLSTSYGEEEESLPPAYMRTVCTMFMLLGTRGVSILFSSGDTGPGAICVTNNRNQTRFQPTFPATCPWVTAVGGTSGMRPEKAVYFSSGGFSDTFDRPGYQREAVDSYLRTMGDMFSGLYTPGGRGFPDVAAQALNYRVVDKGRDILVSGTR
ncbi:MAG: vesicle formation at the endoplasmic reticulum [Watsoniomyces obsoletus]|nr:MAG: vesicle formation at the endoplasmic reticulum [Watsoniomyces obsoletus]